MAGNIVPNHTHPVNLTSVEAQITALQKQVYDIQTVTTPGMQSAGQGLVTTIQSSFFSTTQAAGLAGLTIPSSQIRVVSATLPAGETTIWNGPVNQTLTLPSAPTNGTENTVIVVSATGSLVTLNAGGSDSIATASGAESSCTIPPGARLTLIYITQTATWYPLQVSQPPLSSVPYSTGGSYSTASTTAVMAGLDTQYQPVASGMLTVMFSCLIGTATAAAAASIQGNYGHPAATAPAPGAAVPSGASTMFTAQTVTGAVAGEPSQFMIARVPTLTVGTLYWFDVAIYTSNAADAAQFVNGEFVFIEYPWSP